MYAFVGSTTPGQNNVEVSPGYKQSDHLPMLRSGILPLLKSAIDGSLSMGELQDVGASGWITHHPSNGHIYCTGDGQIKALKVGAGGSLSVFSSADSVGGSAYLELSLDGRWALVANYGDGNMAVFPIHPDGSLGEATDSKHHAVDGLNPALSDRQEACHPHQIRLDPATQAWALSCDLGADCVWVYAFDAEVGALRGAINSKHHLHLPAGSGPRHLDFHPSGKFVYLNLLQPICLNCCAVLRADFTGICHIYSVHSTLRRSDLFPDLLDGLGTCSVSSTQTS